MSAPDVGLQKPEDFFDETTGHFILDASGTVSRVNPSKPTPTESSDAISLEQTLIQPGTKSLIFDQPPPPQVPESAPSIPQRPSKSKKQAALRQPLDVYPGTGLLSDENKYHGFAPRKIIVVCAGALAIAVALLLGRSLISWPAHRSPEHLYLGRPTIELKPKFDTWTDVENQFHQLYQSSSESN